ncbi:MAG: glycosyltransferase [Pseudonocardiaceae bacterium]
MGSFSRFDALIDDTSARHGKIDSRNVLLLLGRGGHEVPFDKLVEVASLTPKWHWYVLGVSAQESGIGSNGNLTILGYVANIWPILCNADVVVGPCGAGTVSEVAAARKPFIALPQERPFDEQGAQARILQKYGLADVAWSWPDTSSWPALLESAVSRDWDRWSWYNDGQGSTRACEVLLTSAAIPR